MSTNDMPMIYGLTGGIASGKSTVSQMFRALDAHVIDADVIAREVVTPPSEALVQIRETFGDEYLDDQGRLNREKLGELVFEDESARSRLNAITHPRIAARMLDRAREAAAAGHRWVLYDAALIVENGLHEAFAGLIVVATDRQTQLERLMSRDGIDREDADSRIDSQMPLEQKVEVADWVIDNNGSLEDTRQQVVIIFEEIERQVLDGET